MLYIFKGDVPKSKGNEYNVANPDRWLNPGPPTGQALQTTAHVHKADIENDP